MSKNTSGEVALVLLGTFTAFVVTVLVRGWVLSTLWLWFVVPLGVAAIGAAQSIGLAILVGMLTHEGVSKKNQDELPLWSLCLTMVLSPLLALALGWLVRFVAA